MLGLALAARWPEAVAVALALLGGQYGLWLSLRGGEIDTRAPLVAAGLLVVAELAYEALERSVAQPGRELVARRALHLAVLAAASVGVGAVILAAAAVPLEGGVYLTALGVAAAALAFALLARLSRTG